MRGRQPQSPAGDDRYVQVEAGESAMHSRRSHKRLELSRKAREVFAENMHEVAKKLEKNVAREDFPPESAERLNGEATSFYKCIPEAMHRIADAVNAWPYNEPCMARAIGEKAVAALNEMWNRQEALSNVDPSILEEEKDRALDSYKQSAIGLAYDAAKANQVNKSRGR